MIDNARLHQSVKRQRDIAERELEIGHQIQTFFFPDAIPDLDGWNISAYSELARQVGGDFYDVFALGENDRREFEWWLGICRALDRRMARELDAKVKVAVE